MISVGAMTIDARVSVAFRPCLRLFDEIINKVMRTRIQNEIIANVCPWIECNKYDLEAPPKNLSTDPIKFAKILYSAHKYHLDFIIFSVMINSKICMPVVAAYATDCRAVF